MVRHPRRRRYAPSHIQSLFEPLEGRALMHVDPSGFSASFNFQPAKAAVPAGYVADAGRLYGARNGMTYGWNKDIAVGALDRNSPASPDQRYDTFLRTGGSQRWEVAVPNGYYQVHVVVGDAGNWSNVYKVNVEGVSAINGQPTSSRRWMESTVTVRVADGRLTLSAGPRAYDNRLAFLEIAAVTHGDGDHDQPAPAPLPGATSPPAAPSGFLATRTSSSTIALEWRDNASNEAGFKIERKTGDNGAWSQIATVGPNVTRYSDGGLQSNTRYVYRVRAYNSAGNSAYSNTDGSMTLTGSTSPAPTPTTGISKITWSTVAASPIARAEAMGAAVNGRLYLMGGVDANGPILRMDLYDPATNRWSRLPDLPKRITHAQPVVDGRFIYLAGGYVGTGRGWEQVWATREVWRFDTVNQTWSAMPQLPVARGGGATVLLGRQMHYYGGSDLGRVDRGEHFVLNLDNPSAGWQTRAAMPNPRSHMAGAVIGGKVYAIGGQHGYDLAAVCQASVHVYDPATDRWTAAANMPRPVSHHTASTFILNGRLIVAGGESAPNRSLRNVIAYNPSTNSWSALTDLPSARTSPVAVALNGAIYFTTGSLQSTTWKGLVS